MGVGTTFKVYLPLAIDSAAAASAANAEIENIKHGSETILVVEDEEGVRDLAKEILESHGYNVLTASDGVKARAVLARSDITIHLMMTDIVMPNEGGVSLVTAATAIRPKLKVLYVSGYSNVAIQRQGVLDAKSHFLEKPFHEQKLAKIVRSILDSK